MNVYIWTDSWVPTNWLLWYRPLQSDLKDASWNWKDWSWYSGTGSFWTVGSKKWAICTLNNVGSDSISTQHIITSLNYSWPTLTICWWEYINTLNSASWNWILTNSSSATSYISLSPRPTQSNKWTVWWNWNLLTVNSAPSTWTWYFVVWVLTSSWKKIYVNWNLAGSDSTWFTTWQWSIWRLWCWQIIQNSTYYWWLNWYVRHCAVYNRELTATEISAFYTNTSN